MTKKLIRINPASWISDDLYINYSKALNFAFVGPDEEVDKYGFKIRTQVSKFVGCREILCKDYRAFVHNFKKTSSQTKEGFPTDMDTLRLLITVINTNLSEEESKKRVFAGKRALNMFEEYGNFKTQSVITTVKHTSKNHKRCWLLTAPKEWVSTPQLLSFASLVLRTSYHLDGGFDTNNIDELIAKFKSFRPYGNEGFKEGSDADNDLGRLNKLSNHILRVFDVREKLFFNEITEAYDPSDKFTDYGYGGIQALFDMATGNIALNKKFENLVLNYNKKAAKADNLEK
jgi:hypothetical protein